MSEDVKPDEGRATEQEGEEAGETSGVKPENEQDEESELKASPTREPETQEGPQVESSDPSGRPSHGRKPSLSQQSRLRSTSFRRTSLSGAPPPAAAMKSPTLPTLSPDGDTMPDIYRKQASRLEELERENRHLSTDLSASDSRYRRAEEELEELRSGNAELVSLRSRAQESDHLSSEINKLRAEVASLTRQNAHLQQTQSHRSNSHPSATSPDSTLQAELDSKTSTIDSMALEISNLRASLSSSDQVTALEQKLSRAEEAAGKAQRELFDARHNLDRQAEKAVKEGVAKTSAETRIKQLEREKSEAVVRAQEAEKKVETLEKKVSTLTTLHRESDARGATRLHEAEKNSSELKSLKKRFAALENENGRLKDGLERIRKRDASGDDAAGVDELEEEERKRMESRVRELEGEIYDLRKGVWRDRRKEIEDQPGSPGFDEVDLSGGLSSPGRRKSLAQPSSFSNVINNFSNAFGGGNTSVPAQGGRASLDLLPDDDEDGFDEEAFRLAQEEEARKQVEWVREVKRGLREWKGWRLDLVDSRFGGGGVGVGEIFEV